jgi:hypothetical protein
MTDLLSDSAYPMGDVLNERAEHVEILHYNLEKPEQV